MNPKTASKLFESLSSPIRLAIFQMLTRAGKSGLVAGDLSKKLDIAPNNLSFHLKTLTHADLVRSEQQGRFVRYYANLDLMKQLAGFLTDECCQDSGGRC
ncbi:metalloregulator ArsR/SmtB family transcription factor [Moraxella nasovis]|uniref:ArsR/SmtB family transcription factor n=1 Tax=Moraxella nasovis TaxID=2904121 RepID=UPI001F61F2C1|nr:metalloregulator ArsR/SmtB family transcription factor [Moraxella nasovis]UNU73841.1 metalloregulator ArsR/SmtB family transcription factor [Moraxella nasovis]